MTKRRVESRNLLYKDELKISQSQNEKKMEKETFITVTADLCFSENKRECSFPSFTVFHNCKNKFKFPIID